MNTSFAQSVSKSGIIAAFTGEQSQVDLVYVTLVAILAWLAWRFYSGLTNPLKAFPGPAYAKFTNLRLKLAVITGSRMYYIHDLHKKYGAFVRVTPTEISISDPEAFLQIHKVNSGFNKSPWYGELTGFERLTLFTMVNPRDHSMRRRLLSRSFSKTYLRQHWEVAVQQNVKLAVNQMSKELKLEGSFDVLKWWTCMATDVSSQLVFGESFRTLDLGEKTEYIRVLESTLMGGGIGAELPVVRAIGRRLPFKACQELFASNDYLTQVAQVAIVNAKSSTTGNDKNLFSQVISESTKNTEGKLDDLDVQLEAIGLIVAGSDTTAITLTYLVWCVLSHPSLQQSLCTELQKLPMDFTETDLEESCPILNAVIEETLRLYGAAPGALPRIVPAEGALFTDSRTHTAYRCLPGTTVSTQAYTIHRDPRLFPEPDKFDHTRFLPTTVQPPNMSRILHPFGAGSRSCLGIHIARLELRLAAAEFFRQFGMSVQLHPSTTASSMEMENFFLIAPRSHTCRIMASR